MSVLLLIIAVVVLSQSGNWIRFAGHVDPAAFGFWRMFLASLVLIPVVVWRKQAKQLIKISPAHAMHLFLCGTLLFIHFYLWFTSVQKTVVANSMVLFTLNPVFTAIGAWVLFRERVYLRHFVSLILGFAGVVWMMKENLKFHPELFLGDMLGLLCAIAFSAYVLSGKYLRARMDNTPMALGVYVVCGAWFFIAMLALKIPFVGYGTHGWIGIAGLTLGSTLLGHFLLTYLVKFLNVNLISYATLAEPVLTALVAYWLFKEPITPGTVAGFVLISLGVLVLYAPGVKARRDEVEAE